MNRLIDHAINAAVTVAAVALNTVAELWSPTPYDRVERAYNDLLDAAETACWHAMGIDHTPGQGCGNNVGEGAEQSSGAQGWNPPRDQMDPPSTSDGEGCPADCDIPPSPAGQRPSDPTAVQPKPAVGLSWVDWATPAICDVLTNHQPTWRGKALECCQPEGTSCGWFEDLQEWRDHVAELIAWRLESASKQQ